MKTRCQNCNQKLEIPEELIGSKIECPACNNNIEIGESISSNDVNRLSKNDLQNDKISRKIINNPVSRMISNSLEEDKPKYEMLFYKKALFVICCLSLFAVFAVNIGLGLIPMFLAAWWAYKYMFPGTTSLDRTTPHSAIITNNIAATPPKWLLPLIGITVLSSLLIMIFSGPQESYSITFPSESEKLVVTFDLYSDGSTSISAKGGPHQKYRGEKGSWELKGSTITLEAENHTGKMVLVFNKNTLDVSKWNVFGESFPSHLLDLVRN